MRVVISIVLALVLVGLGLWLFDVPPFGERVPPEPPVPQIFPLVAAGDPAAISAAVAAGADVHARNEAGLTPIMAAVAGSAPTAVIEALLDAGADINQQAANGLTALMLAAGEGTPAQVIYLLNAGADPTVADAEGRKALDHANDNSAVRTSGAFVRLTQMSDIAFVRGWPSAYVVPVEGATISSRRNHLPGAPRGYRNGVHEGFDFYDGTVSVNIEYGTPIRAAADGVVIRADRDYVEHTIEEYDAIITEATALLATPPELLDELRGRQVWIEHAGGFVTRYAHLAAIAEGVTAGTTVKQGDIIATTGNTGTLEAAQGTRDGPHPHVEIWRGDTTFLGSGLEPEQIWRIAAQVFGEDALPPFHD
ncbi:MAG TPA: ankyrin repeat domain-containing protein [Trueperaceae bacterium]|nr:ankyrin repeat domain-containing protein [Trueperaceae bacterium]